MIYAFKLKSNHKKTPNPAVYPAGVGVKNPGGVGVLILGRGFYPAGVDDPGFLPRRGRGRIFFRGFNPVMPVFGVFYPEGNGVKKTGSGF